MSSTAPAFSSQWMLPGELADVDAANRRRTTRDWAADLALFALAVWAWWTQQATWPPDHVADTSEWMLRVDPWLGGAACLALWWRRRFPLLLGVLMVPVLVITATGFGAVLIMVLTMAVHRGWPRAAALTAVYMGLTVPFAFLYPEPGLSSSSFAALVSMMFLVPFTVGIAVRVRRQLVLSLRRDAAHQRREHRQRLAGARQAERQRIAREMHDVLAHRLSLLSVHAGALEYRTSQAAAGIGAPMATSEVVQTIEVIRDNARDALRELGEVLRLLRTDPDDSSPQPRLSDVAALVDEARSAGQPVALTLDCPDELAQRLRPQAERTVFRTIQEGLTNARKHAPHMPVTVEIALSTDSGAAVTIRNRLSFDTAVDRLPGSGSGLAGLAERVELDGGTMDSEAADGAFTLVVRLPWQP